MFVFLSIVGYDIWSNLSRMLSVVSVFLEASKGKFVDLSVKIWYNQKKVVSLRVDYISVNPFDRDS